MKKLKYPEYINGVKQVQNPVSRFFIKLWYSNWFRYTFIICPLWLFVTMAILMYCFPETSEIVRYAGIFCFVTLYFIELKFDDYTNLNRIGLDTFHRPLKEQKDK